MSKPTSITVELDLDSHLRRIVTERDEDGEPIYGNVTLEDLVIEKVAQSVADSLHRDITRELLTRAISVFEKSLAEKMGGIVTKALEAVTSDTDHYGNVRGEPRTLAERIVEIGRKELVTTNTRDAYSRNQTVLDKMLADEVRRAIRKDLNAAMQSAQNRVRDSVEAEGARIIRETIERAK